MKIKIAVHRSHYESTIVIFPTIIISTRLFDMCYNGIRIKLMFVNFAIVLTILFKSWEEKENGI